MSINPDIFQDRIISKIENGEANVNKIDHSGKSVGYYAAQAGYYRLLKKILEIETFPIDHQDNEGATMLHSAVISNSPETVILLLSFGASTEMKNNMNFTPIELAEKLQLMEIREILTNSAAYFLGNK